MGILLGFAPFLVFAVVDQWGGTREGLIAGALVSLGLLIRDLSITRRAPKVLEIGTTILFGSLALYSIWSGPAWSILGVRLLVDVGLLLIVLISMAIGRPFTIQYAREQVPRERWDSARFRQVNYVITGAWAAAFVVIVIADLIMLDVPTIPRWVGVLVTVAALVGAIKFTQWYPDRKTGRV
jgi:hypothetical protein